MKPLSAWNFTHNFHISGVFPWRFPACKALDEFLKVDPGNPAARAMLLEIVACLWTDVAVDAHGFRFWFQLCWGFRICSFCKGQWSSKGEIISNAIQYDRSKSVCCPVAWIYNLRLRFHRWQLSLVVMREHESTVGFECLQLAKKVSLKS